MSTTLDTVDEQRPPIRPGLRFGNVVSFVWRPWPVAVTSAPGSCGAVLRVVAYNLVVALFVLAERRSPTRAVRTVAEIEQRAARRAAAQAIAVAASGTRY
mgnify:CR=1 FL=1